jgi:hypothetical protein
VAIEHAPTGWPRPWIVPRVRLRVLTIGDSVWTFGDTPPRPYAAGVWMNDIERRRNLLLRPTCYPYCNPWSRAGRGDLANKEFLWRSFPCRELRPRPESSGGRL